MDKVKAERTRIEKLGVISCIDEPTEWCAGMVVVPKSSGQAIICINFTKQNMSVKRENVPFPSVEESSAKLAKFLGQIIDSPGRRVDPDKVKAIVEMERPDDISGIRRLLCMVNQLNKFSPKIT